MVCSAIIITTTHFNVFVYNMKIKPSWSIKNGRDVVITHTKCTQIRTVQQCEVVLQTSTSLFTVYDRKKCMLLTTFSPYHTLRLHFRKFVVKSFSPYCVISSLPREHENIYTANIHSSFYKQTKKTHFLYAFIRQSFCKLYVFRKAVSFIIRSSWFTVSAALYKPCTRALTALTVGTGSNRKTERSENKRPISPQYTPSHWQYQLQKVDRVSFEEFVNLKMFRHEPWGSESSAIPGW